MDRRISRAHGPLSGNPWTPWDVARTVWGRRYTFGFVALIGVVFAAGAATIWPIRFDSEAKLFVRMGRENMTVDPTASTGQLVAVQSSRDTELNSLIEILNSRALASRTVDRLGPAAILASEGATERSAITEAKARLKAALRSVGLLNSSEIPDAERATKKLMSMFRVWTPSRSSVIAMRVRSGTPESARTILATMLDIYHEEHLRINHNEGALDFFVEQAAVDKREREAAAEQLRAAKNRLGLVSIEGERGLILNAIGSLEQRSLASASARAIAEQRVQYGPDQKFCNTDIA
ncbi:MAG: hypothetical protein FJ297_19030 [Planctomycetes bacterium]|nr:hypothetical protein [Planctomycetota bacterium]